MSAATHAHSDFKPTPSEAVTSALRGLLERSEERQEARRAEDRLFKGNDEQFRAWTATLDIPRVTRPRRH